MRRHSETLKLVIGIVGGILFIYGFYAYNDLHMRYKRTEENNDKLQQLHESLSSQLQVVYEHKSRLEKTVQQEKLEYSKARDEWDVERTELQAKQKQLAGRVDTINKDLGMLKGRYEDLETDYSKLQEEHRKLSEDHRILTDQHNDEYRQFKVDCENQMAQLRDQVADSRRRLDECRTQLGAVQHPPRAGPPAQKRRRPDAPSLYNNDNVIPNLAPADSNEPAKKKLLPADNDDNNRPNGDRQRVIDHDQDSDNRVERDFGNNAPADDAAKPHNMQVPQPQQIKDVDPAAADDSQLNLRRAGVVANDHEVKHQVAPPQLPGDHDAAAGDARKVKGDDGGLEGRKPAAGDAGDHGNHPAGGAIDNNAAGFAVVPPDVHDNIGRVGGAGDHAGAGGQGQGHGGRSANEEEKPGQQRDNGEVPQELRQPVLRANDDAVHNQALKPPPAPNAADPVQPDDGDDNDENGDADDNPNVGAKPANPPEAIGNQLKKKEDVDGDYQEDYKNVADNHQ